MAGAPTAVDAADGERSVFIEMDEYIPAEHRWVETHRWNYGMEEDLVGGHWMAAHLPTVSARALATLIASTSDTSSIVLTAEEVGEANRPKKRHQTLRGLVRTVLSGLLNAQRITEDECEAALRALLAHPKSLRPPREVDADAAAADVDVLEELDMLAPDATAEEALEIMVAPVLKAGPRNTGNIDDRAGAYVTSTAAAARGGAGVARARATRREWAANSNDRRRDNLAANVSHPNHCIRPLFHAQRRLAALGGGSCTFYLAVAGRRTLDPPPPFDFISFGPRAIRFCVKPFVSFRSRVPLTLD